MDYGFQNNEEALSQDVGSDTQVTESLAGLCQELFEANSPAFVVLDGAKFSDLPNALLRARLVSRPLYADRGGQIRDFDLTSPQMVYLDRSRDSEQRSEDGPCELRILSAVRELMEDRSAGVFWSCRQGGDILFHHLRKINRVRVEAGHLPATDETQVDRSVDDVLLFRHADANVMAQILPVLPQRELGRLMGPAEAIRFVPDIVWSIGHQHYFTSINTRSETPIGGMLRFDSSVMSSIETRRSVGVVRYLIVTCSDYLEKFGSDYKSMVIAAYHRAVSYGLETLEDLETFVQTECEFGPRFELRAGHEEAEYILAHSDKSPSERVFYARRACLDAASH